MFTSDQEHTYNENEDRTKIGLDDPIDNETEKSNFLDVHVEDKVNSMSDENKTELKKQEVSTS